MFYNKCWAARLLELSARHLGNTASLLKIVCILRLLVQSSSEVAGEVGGHNSFVANLVNILTGDRLAHFLMILHNVY